MVPDGLGDRGRRFWDDVQARYEFAPDETELLVEVCRTLDLLEALQPHAQVPGADPRVVRELRQTRAELRHLLSALALPHDDGSSVESGNTDRARKAAQARWARKDRDDAESA